MKSCEYIRLSAISEVKTPAGYTAVPPLFISVVTSVRPPEDTYSIISNQFQRSAAIVGATAVFIAFAVSYFFSRPILKIVEKVPLLAKGEFSFPVKYSGSSEIAELVETLNGVNSSIAKTDEIRNSLFANVSHDLKTPLTMIRAYAEKIIDITGEKKDLREKDLKIIIDESMRLNNLVTDILSLSKLQTGVEKLNLTEYNLSENLAGIVSRFGYLSEKNVKVVTDITPSIFITADQSKFEQVIYNLINNAALYGKPESNTITVSLKFCDYHRHKIRLSVTDKGIGIPPDKLQNIWDRYYKANNAISHSRSVSGGSGLGLSIVKNILDLHKFNYGVYSTEGAGSTFWAEVFS
jgi:signal transduction histidine kinase